MLSVEFFSKELRRTAQKNFSLSYFNVFCELKEMRFLNETYDKSPHQFSVQFQLQSKGIVCHIFSSFQ